MPSCTACTADRTLRSPPPHAEAPRMEIGTVGASVGMSNVMARIAGFQSQLALLSRTPTAPVAVSTASSAGGAALAAAAPARAAGGAPFAAALENAVAG